MEMIWSLIRWLRGNQPLVSLPVIEVRHMICESCPARRRGWFRFFCDLCGCTLSRRRWPFNKLAMPHEECPIKRWSKV
jgi:hypothetical protein